MKGFGKQDIHLFSKHHHRVFINYKSLSFELNTSYTFFQVAWCSCCLMAACFSVHSMRHMCWSSRHPSHGAGCRRINCKSNKNTHSVLGGSSGSLMVLYILRLTNHLPRKWWKLWTHFPEDCTHIATGTVFISQKPPIHRIHRYSSRGPQIQTPS